MAGAAVASGLASLFGGIISADINAYNNEKINNTNWLRQQELNERNYQVQKEFYQNSIQWRKQDALSAGINPIYALGASSASFTPSFQAYYDTAIKDPTAENINNAINAGLQTYQATQQSKEQKAQTNLLNKQAELVEFEKAMKDAQKSYYTALTAKALKDEPTTNSSSINITNNLPNFDKYTKTEPATTQYKYNDREFKIDSNSQTTQEMASEHPSLELSFALFENCYLS